MRTVYKELAECCPKTMEALGTMKFSDPKMTDAKACEILSVHGFFNDYISGNPITIKLIAEMVSRFNGNLVELHKSLSE